MPNLLLTSVGRRVELVRAFQAAYTEFQLDGSIVATDIDWLAPAMHVVDRAYLTDRTTSESFIPAICEICSTESIDLVLPLIDPDIPVLAQHRQEIEATGAKLGVVGEVAAEIASDKWLAYQFFSNNGVPTPQSWLPEERKWESSDFPLFIKPRHGSAGENTFRANSAEELARLAQCIPNPIVQQLMPGPEITCDIVCDWEGSVMAIVQRERIAVRGGEAIKSKSIFSPEIDAACRQIAAHLPATGPITAQCMLKDGRPHFIEINARVGGGLPLAIAAGVNVPALLLSLVCNQIPASALNGTYRSGVHMSRCDESIFLTEDDREKIDGRHI